VYLATTTITKTFFNNMYGTNLTAITYLVSFDPLREGTATEISSMIIMTYSLFT